MDRVWDRAVRANPALFDGPAAALTGLERAGHDELVLSWARATYRHRALRQVPGAPACASLFVSVLQPADDGSVLVGRMSPTTAAPGRWQLPGGTIEPPCAEGALGLADLREHAARELAEETGSDIQAADLAHWLITRGTQGNVGVFFLAPPRPARELRARYATLAEAETARGVDPEFDRIALVGSPADLMDLEGPHVDFLRPVVHRYTAG
ncbi:NUDIX domain-containing protein [Streptomyces sp. NPDC040750]|uniref:NUDIX hydrolase n=1 Tax=Streptomyces sp. NPDC040750 TaxID=3154491 RepID=UPI0033E7A0DD